MIRIDGVDHEASPAVVELIHSLQVQVHEIPDLLVIAHMQGAGQTQDQIRALRARVDELSRSYAVQGLALEELTAERDRYREALRPFAALDPYKWGSEERVAILAARAALKELTK